MPQCCIATLHLSVLPAAASKVGPTGVSPAPYDPSTVASVVRYGLAEDELDQLESGSKRVVYEYKYGKGYGDVTYQVLHPNFQ
jgi:hypothetical protein